MGVLEYQSALLQIYRRVEGKSYDRGNVKANSTYGTPRINAYRIIEETLNLKDVRIYDYVEDAEGKKKAILNKRETAIAQGKAGPHQAGLSGLGLV